MNAEEELQQLVLPEEIIIKIFLYMNPKELNRLRQVCKSIAHSNQEYIWKKMYANQSKIPLTKVPSTNLRVTMIKTENSIMKILERHE